MSDLKPLDTKGYHRPTRLDSGQKPELAFVPVANLRVNTRYQRPVFGRGRNNINKIASQFRWSHFSPLVVAPVADTEPQLYVLVDGQHRATAAMLCGIKHLPAYVITADVQEQAKAFSAINGCVTKITPMQLHWSALEAGDKDAEAVHEVCAAAGVTILRYPVQASNQRPAQTMAVRAIQGAIQRHGPSCVITALQCMTETVNNEPGIINQTTIKGICAALDRRPSWREAGTLLFDAIDEFDIAAVLENWYGSGARSNHLAGALVSHLDSQKHRLPPSKAVVAA